MATSMTWAPWLWLLVWFLQGFSNPIIHGCLDLEVLLLIWCNHRSEEEDLEDDDDKSLHLHGWLLKFRVQEKIQLCQLHRQGQQGIYLFLATKMWPPSETSLFFSDLELTFQVYEDKNMGILCYTDENGELVCEGLDEGPRLTWQDMEKLDMEE